MGNITNPFVLDTGGIWSGPSADRSSVFILADMLSLTQLASTVARAALPRARPSDVPASRLVAGVTRLPAAGAPFTVWQHSRAPVQTMRIVCTSHAVYTGTAKVDGEVCACYKRL